MKKVFLNYFYLQQSALTRWTLAITIFAFAACLRLVILPIDAGVIFITFYPATALSFYLCGIRAGMFISLLSAITGYYFFAPPYFSFKFNHTAFTATVFYFSFVTVMGVIFNKMQRHLLALKISEQRYLDILEQQSEMICRFKIDGTILYVNQAFCDFFGKLRQELIGNKWFPLAFKDDVDFVNEELTKINKNNPVVIIENRIISANGEICWGHFINKGFFDEQENLIELQSVGRDITEKKQYQEQIEKIAYHDILTGLPNRLLVRDRLDQSVALAQRTGKMLAVCYLDLDGFKPVNDTFGHEAGDKLLKEIAYRMQLSIRTCDTVGRLGGDEFVLILNELDKLDDYKIVLDRVFNHLQLPILLSPDCQASVGASIGVAFYPENHTVADVLLRYADEAMYYAKKTGRNQICLFSENSI